jgi:hypothetical protein
MNNPSNNLCPKCNKAYLKKIHYDTCYDVYIHERLPNTKRLDGITKYCIVEIGYNYNHPVIKKEIKKLHPEYRKTKLED